MPEDILNGIDGCDLEETKRLLGANISCNTDDSQKIVKAGTECSWMCTDREGKSVVTSKQVVCGNGIGWKDSENADLSLDGIR